MQRPMPLTGEFVGCESLVNQVRESRFETVIVGSRDRQRWCWHPERQSKETLDSL